MLPVGNKKIFIRVPDENYFNTPLRRIGYVLHGGQILPPAYEDCHEQIENFEVKDTDSWVVGVIKAGTTWTQEMVWLLNNDLDYETAKKIDVSIRCPNLEDQTYLENVALGDHVNHSVSFCANMVEPRAIKTHLPWKLLPEQIRSGEKKPKIFYIYRDPRDVLISLHHYLRVFEGSSKSFEQLLDVLVEDKVISHPFWSHVLGVWNERQRDNILFIRYDDMKKDLKSVIRKAAKFLNKEYEDKDIDTLATHLSFENMKKNPSVNFVSYQDTLKALGIKTRGGDFMRKGISGEYKTILTEEQIEIIKKWSERKLTGSDFQM